MRGTVSCLGMVLVAGCAEAHPTPPSDAGRDGGMSWPGESEHVIVEGSTIRPLVVDSRGRVCAASRENARPTTIRYGCFEGGLFVEQTVLARGNVYVSELRLDARDRPSVIVLGDAFEAAGEAVASSTCWLHDIGSGASIELAARCMHGPISLRSVAYDRERDHAVALLSTEDVGSSWNGLTLAPYVIAFVDDFGGTPRLDPVLSVPSNLGPRSVRVDGRGGFVMGGDYVASPDWGVPPGFGQRGFVMRLDATTTITSVEVADRELTTSLDFTLGPDGGALAIASEFASVSGEFFERPVHRLVIEDHDAILLGAGANALTIAATREHLAVGLHFQNGASFESDSGRIEAASRDTYALAAFTREGRLVRAWPIDGLLVSNVVALPDGTFAIAVGGTLRVLSPE